MRTGTENQLLVLKADIKKISRHLAILNDIHFSFFTSFKGKLTLMENQQYEILKYLEQAGIPVHPDDLPHRIKVMFDPDAFGKGGYYHQMAFILCEHNKWLKKAHHGTDYFILDTDGVKAMLAHDEEKKQTEIRQIEQDQ